MLVQSILCCYIVTFVASTAAVDCGELDSPANGMVTTAPSTVYQSVATYECEEGYNLVGDMTRECQASGEWSNSAPQCESKFSCSII